MEPADLKRFIGQYLWFSYEEGGQTKDKVEFKLTRVKGRNSQSFYASKEEVQRVLDNLFTNTYTYYLGIPHSNGGDIPKAHGDAGSGGVHLFRRWAEGAGKTWTACLRAFTGWMGPGVNSGGGSGIGLAVVKGGHIRPQGIVHAENRGDLAIIIHLPPTERNSMNKVLIVEMTLRLIAELEQGLSWRPAVLK